MAKVVLVNNDENIQAIIIRVLEKAGHRVAETTDHLMAIDMVRTFNADLFVTTLTVSTMEGATAIINVKEKHPDVKILVLPGQQSRTPLNFPEVASKFGADSALPPPFTPLDFLTQVNRLIA